MNVSLSLYRAFRDGCVIGLCETWLYEAVPDEEVTLDNFILIRSDRTTGSGKMRGGGVCLYINNRWCNNIKVHHRMCSPDLEMLTMSLRPFYILQEFPTIMVSCAYVAPSANTKIAADLLDEDAKAMMARGISTHTDWTMCCHHSISMWILLLGRETYWTCATIILPMHSGPVPIHRWVDRNSRVTRHNATAPHSGLRTPLHNFNQFLYTHKYSC